MKKNRKRWTDYWCVLKKPLLMMKWSLFFLILSVFQANAYIGFAQKTQLSLDFKGTSIESILNEIENQSDYYFLYNKDLVDVNRKVDIEVANQNINSVLDQLFNNSDVIYRIFDRQVVLSQDENIKINQSLQIEKLTGKVTDASGAPLPGVSIVIKGTTNGTITDFNGIYTLSNAPSNAIIQFSFVGMKMKEISVDGKTSIDIVMEEDAIGLDEVIAIGYGTLKKSDLTGAVERVSSNSLETKPITNVIEALSGIVPGLYSNQGTYAKGGGSMEIRGTNSFAANENPLIVIDGVIYSGNIGDINPNDIENIDVLKDASSAAVFGARSASGVIVITTKKGSISKPTINFSSKIGVVGLTKHLYPFGSEDYLKLRTDYFKRMTGDSYPEGYFNNPRDLPDGLSLDEWKNFDIEPTDNPDEMWMGRLSFSPRETENYLAGKTTDWYDKIVQNGIRQNYDFSISGGLENLKYFFSAGYVNNEGFTLGDEYKTFRSRVNISADLSNFLTIGLNAQFANRNEGSYRIDISEAVKQSPWTQIRDDDGNLYYWPNEDLIVSNPFTYYYNREIYNKTQTLFGVLFAEFKLPHGVSYRINYSNNFSWNNSYLYDPVETPRGLTYSGYGQRDIRTANNWMIDNIVKWNYVIAKIHSFDVTFLVNIEKNLIHSDLQSNYGMEPSGALGYHALQAGTHPSITNNDVTTTGNALMARLNYILKNKYLLTLAWRRDGFSAFGQENPYADFPSAALAWTLSNENFFKIYWISNLKLRLSWGINGNRDIGAYEALARLSTRDYLYGNSPAIGVYSSTMANSNLKWERTESFNLGVDYGFLDSRIYGSINLYKSTTTDLLLNRTLPQLIGYSSVMSNLGELENKGVELSLNSVNVNNANITWKSNLTFSLNRNKIVSLYGDMVGVYDESGNVLGQKETDDITNEWFIGQSIDRIWDYEILGIWQTNEVAEAEVYGKEPGDFKLRDVNEDGILNPLDDKVFQGYKKPQYVIGLRNEITFLQNFNFSIDMRADLGFEGSNTLYTGQDTNSPWDRRNGLIFDYWTPDNQNNEWPRLVPDLSSPSFSIWKNRSFMRIQDMTLSYNFPKSKIQRFNLDNLRVFTNLHNYITLTKWSHYDPESGTQPMPKYITLGLNVGF